MGDAALLAAINPRIAALPESGIVELANYGRAKADLIPLWIGEGDRPTPDFIGEAAMAALREGHTFYTWQRGIPPLRRALGAWLGRTYGVEVAPERTIVTIGGMQAVMQTMQMLLGPGDEAVAPAPVWPNIGAAVEIVGGRVVSVPLRLQGAGPDGADGADGAGRGNARWTLDLDRLFDAIGPRTRALFINSPGNPTGWIMSRADQIAVRDFARKRGLWIVADEVYGRLVYDMPAAPSFLQVCEPDERLVVVGTFSKNWAMTGWRIGWLVGPEALGQVFENLVQYSTSGVPTFLQYGAAAALERGDAHLAATVARCRRGRDIVCDALAPLAHVRFARPQGAFYLYLSVAGETDSRALAFRLVDEAGVGLAPGAAFGPDSEGFMRLCFAVSHDKLQAAMARLVPALAR